ncbi:MAG: ester cyclase [Egibacteraceae bacterium]
MTTADEHKQIVLRYIEEVWNKNDPSKFDEFVAPDAVFHDLVREGSFPPGRAAAQENMRRFQKAFGPDMTMEIHDVIAEGDRVVFRFTSDAVHRGEFQGFPPTYRSGTVNGLVVVRMEDGRIAEGWAELDQMGVARQLGLMPGRMPRPLARAMVAGIRLRDRLARRRSSGDRPEATR